MRSKLFGFLLVVCAFLFSVQVASAFEIEIRKGRIINLPAPATHVFIANPNIADIDVRSPTYIYVYGVGIGETTIDAVDANNKSVYQDVVTVVPSSSNIQKNLQKILPGANIKLEPVGNSLVLKGIVDSPKEAEAAVAIANAILEPGRSLINLLEVRGSDQVMLKVRIAEVARSELKNFGININSIFTRGSFIFSAFTGRDFTGVGGVLTPEGNNLRAQGSAGRFNLDGVIDALENEGLVKTLAEPNLTAKSGAAATFLAGGEYPVPVPQGDGVIAIEYKEFGVTLDFTPVVLSEDRISLQVAPSVSTISDSVVTIDTANVPTLAKRSVSTTVELGSGESFAIAGLLQNSSNNSISKFPWLGDVPVLGMLFRSNEFQNDQTELVVMVTPYIVRPVKNPDKMISPTEGLEEPNDFERIVLGRLYNSAWEPGRDQSTVMDGPLAKLRLNGEPGYIIEEVTP